MRKYKAVVIGCGTIGAAEWLYPTSIRPATHAAAFFQNTNITLVGLCDTNLKQVKKAGKFFPGVPLYSSAAAMLKETKPDIVSVAAHQDSHYELVAMAARLGVKAIICEKPMANSLQEAKSMVKICREKKCLLFINHSRHFDGILSQWQAKVKKGILGNIFQAHCLYHNGLFNNGTHMVDLLRWFLGEAKSVSGVYNNSTSNPKRDKNIDATIYFANGARATLQSLPEKSGLTEWAFYGRKGNVFLKNLGMDIHYQNTKSAKPRSLMAQMVSHVVACLEGKEKPKSTGQDGLEVLKILFAIKESAKNNGKVIKVY